ncbi:hypothetical protein PHMEG_00012158 [Phytophthora megakarya]|uniref:Uncharacterized protein n=1 Tax=Phytophthora megakarya TaxID=4795 RepID=A0A225W9F9_9STRA|nr:hypothetical protein PHMEG_00012158 [Phytophthora megakarya]
MASVDWEDLTRQVTEIQRNTVSTRSRAVYQNSYCRFISWVVLYKPLLLRASETCQASPSNNSENA